MKVELPSGNTVELRERVSNRDRKVYVKMQQEGDREEIAISVPILDDNDEPVLDGEGQPTTELRAVKAPTPLSSLEITNAMLSLLIEAWTFDWEIPSAAANEERRDEILDFLLDIEDYDYLSDKARPIVGKLFVSDKASKDKEAPTGPSSD